MNNQNIKIAFVNNCMIDIDMSTIEESNPGIGGTEYLFLNVPYQLNKYKGYEITIYSKYDVEIKNANNIQLKRLKTIDEAYQDAVNNNIDIFITREDMMPSKKIESKTKLVLWLHLTHSYQETKQYTQLFDYIIFVSRYERDKYCFDKSIREKSVSMYNIVPNFIGYDINNTTNNNTICFIGSLNPGKGFSSLTRLWPNVIKKSPNAKLIVIGSGNLYDPNQKLGPLGIAEDYYENEIMQPLIQTNTQDTVKFLGKMNTYQINNILRKVDVGVTNLPTNIGETFCMTVFDFARFHIPVIVRRTGGIKEVTCKKNSFCYKTLYGLKKQIIRSLKKDKKRLNKGVALYNKNSSLFNSNLLLNDWEKVITDIYTNKTQKVNIKTITIKALNYFFNNVKNCALISVYSIIKIKNKILRRI